VPAALPGRRVPAALPGRHVPGLPAALPRRHVPAAVPGHPVLRHLHQRDLQLGKQKEKRSQCTDII